MLSLWSTYFLNESIVTFLRFYSLVTCDIHVTKDVTRNRLYTAIFFYRWAKTFSFLSLFIFFSQLLCEAYKVIIEINRRLLIAFAVSGE